MIACFFQLLPGTSAPAEASDNGFEEILVVSPSLSRDRTPLAEMIGELQSSALAEIERQVNAALEKSLQDVQVIEIECGTIERYRLVIFRIEEESVFFGRPIMHHDRARD